MSRIVIIGGHGRIALRLAARLSGQGHAVTALFRNPAHHDAVAATGATPVVFDIEHADVDDIARQLAGHDAVVWSAGAGGGNPTRTYAVDRDAAIRSMDAAAQAGVRRYVMVSYLGAGPDHGVPEDDGFFAYAQAKAAADAHLRASALDWTILGPGLLTDTAGSGRVADAGNGADTRTPTARDTVAHVAQAVLDTPGTIGRTLDFVDGDVPVEAFVADAVQTTTGDHR